jgi:hypothetical protein
MAERRGASSQPIEDNALLFRNRCNRSDAAPRPTTNPVPTHSNQRERRAEAISRLLETDRIPTIGGFDVWPFVRSKRNACDTTQPSKQWKNCEKRFALIPQIARRRLGDKGKALLIWRSH